MIETSFHGVYLPGLMLLNGGALACSWALRRLLSLAGVYRWVWHPALFDLAVYVLLLFALARFTGAFAT
ncbi:MULTISPECIES: DUF1656 domain-containing protein [unclassified Variovorax]|jgi:hypothetical protein|uniref:DUF1656 domain-containing protein n=1 Tax=unclassified Variovorax TaxID=663243 RepID=UPI0008F2063A|nr:DUF1656 domain-containing protein [Variovorax sp. PDC80]SFO76737.1 Protein of unknown function [Variovorax sp. PDC80]